jgi:F-type H+-transporting ATPase subunit b
MDQVLHSFAGLLLKALPTFILVVVLHFYLKRVFFKPLDKVLQDRDEATEGTRRRAEQSRERAASLAADYEAALSAVRRDIYQEQDETRRRSNQERASAIEESRARAAGMVRQAKAELAEQAASAKVTLAGESDRLAGEIAECILRGGRS